MEWQYTHGYLWTGNAGMIATLARSLTLPEVTLEALWSLLGDNAHTVVWHDTSLSPLACFCSMIY